MITIQISVNTTRKTVQAMPEETVSQVLTNNNINTAGVNMHLNGMMLSMSDAGKTLAELGVQENTTAMLCAVVKADSNK